MKIALTLEHFDERRGGLENWTGQFARRLVAGGHDVHVVACGFNDSTAQAPWHCHPVAPSPSPIQRASGIETTVRQLHADIIHDMGCGWHADIFHLHGGSSAAFREYNLMRIPRWRQFRLWREKRYREQEAIETRQQTTGKALFVAVSHMVKGHLQTIHHLPENRIRLIPNGVDTEHFSPAHRQVSRDAMRHQLHVRTDEVLFLMVAHNLRLKNAEAALRGLSRLVREGHPAHLAIVGGKKPQPFVKLAQKLGVENQVSFFSPISDVRPYYAAADVHLHPTWYDPCSLVALEALACGLPLITTRFNGVSELMTNGQEGFLMDHPADLESLTGMMRKLLDPASRTTMAIASRKLAEKHTFDQQTREFLALYDDILNTRPGS